jgi:hypothetical protein
MFDHWERIAACTCPEKVAENILGIVVHNINLSLVLFNKKTIAPTANKYFISASTFIDITAHLHIRF